MKTMTTPEARREATRRWGAGGFALCPSGIFQVGCGAILAGDGYSWDEAFAEADKSVYLTGYLRMLTRLDTAVAA